MVMTSVMEILNTANNHTQMNHWQTKLGLENYERETEQERRQFEEYTQRMQGEIPLDLW